MTMASVTLFVGANEGAFNNFIGNGGKIYYFDPVTRVYENPRTNQGQMNGQLAAYQAGQPAIDQAFTDFEKGRDDQVKKGKFDLDGNLQAVVAWATDEINTLRALHALPALTPAQVDADIKTKIDNP